MKKKIRILLITDEVWNDEIHGNNVLSNWFEGFNAEIANIYCSPGQPLNKCCKRYFQITDKMMIMSLFGGKKAGKMFYLQEENLFKERLAEPANAKMYSFFKSITTESVRLLREFVWSCGHYDTNTMKKFIFEFKPDIIFCPRKASLKLLRLEQIVKQIAEKPMIAFTGDDEYSLKQVRFSPVYWLGRLMLRYKLRRNVHMYNLYYTLSKKQGIEYRENFKIETKTLYKCGDFSSSLILKDINKPIKMVYAGKLYCNRWITLSKIAEVLRKLNINEKKIILEIYTKDRLSIQQRKKLDDGYNSFVIGAVSTKELYDIYRKADIALHVESFDFTNKLLTRYSFSTKIIDCLASTCAVMAICWKGHAGYTYLEKEDAAFCIDSYDKIQPTLQRICANPDLIYEFSLKAWNCGIRNHNRHEVQTQLYNDFKKIIERNRLE